MLRSDESNPFDIRLFFNPPFHGSPEGSLRRGAAGREGPDAGRTLGKVLSTSCSGSLEGPWTALKRGKDGVLDRLFSSLGQGPEEPEPGPGPSLFFDQSITHQLGRSEHKSQLVTDVRLDAGSGGGGKFYSGRQGGPGQTGRPVGQKKCVTKRPGSKVIDQWFIQVSR